MHTVVPRSIRAASLSCAAILLATASTLGAQDPQVNDRIVVVERDLNSPAHPAPEIDEVLASC